MFHACPIMREDRSRFLYYCESVSRLVLWHYRTVFSIYHPKRHAVIVLIFLAYNLRMSDDKEEDPSTSNEGDIEDPAEDVNVIRQRALALLERCGPTDSDDDDYEDEESEEEASLSVSSSEDDLYDDDVLDPLVNAVRELSSSLETDIAPQRSRRMTDEERRTHNDTNSTTKCALFLIFIGVLGMYHLWLLTFKHSHHHVR